MKEIGKLLELLNEYVEKWNKSDLYYTFGLDSGWLFCYDDVTDHKGWTMQDEAMVICSKKFGFISWLVENDKIGDNKNSDRYTMMKLMRAEINEGTEVFEGTERYEFVIMLLSIQDNPIEFLISILK